MKNERIYANGPKPKFLVLQNGGEIQEVDRALKKARKREFRKDEETQLYLHQDRILRANAKPDGIVSKDDDTEHQMQIRFAEETGKIIIMAQIPAIIEDSEISRIVRTLKRREEAETEYTDQFASMTLTNPSNLDEIFERLARIKEANRKLRQWDLERPIIGMKPREGWDQRTQAMLNKRAEERLQIESELNAELADMLI